MILRKQIASWLLVLLFVCGASVTLSEANAAPADQNTTIPAAIGRWVSNRCEVRSAGNGNYLYVKRDATFTASASSLTLVVYAEPSCQTPNLTFVFDGPYTVNKPSAAVAGAYETDFKFATAKLTPQNDGIVQLLNSAPAGACGTAPWQLNGTQDITGTNGCLVLGVDLRACPQEYDLLKVDGNNLYYGERPSNGGGPCSVAQRPTSLQVPLVRANLPTAPASGAGGTMTASAGITPLLIAGLLTLLVVAGGLVVRRRFWR